MAVNSDIPPPFITCPLDIIAQLPEEQNFVRVSIPQPKSNVDWWSYVEADPPWAKILEGKFLLGITLITFRARSPSSNLTAACKISIQVQDYVKPTTEDCPDDFDVYLEQNQRSRVVTWREPIFTDNDGIQVTIKSKEPGSTLRAGKHLITYTAIDKAGNRAQCYFTVNVKTHPLTIRKPLKARQNHRKATNSFQQNIGFLCPFMMIRRTEIITKYWKPCQMQGNQYSPTVRGNQLFTPAEHRVRHHHDRGLNNAITPLNNHLQSISPSLHDDPSIFLPQINLTIQPASTYSRNPINEVTLQQKPAELLKVPERLTTTPTPSTSPMDEVRFGGERSLEDEQRMRKYEVELIKWRENMRRYYMEMERLQDNSRSYSPG